MVRCTLTKILFFSLITASEQWSHFLIGNKGSHIYNGNINYICDRCLKVYKRENNFKKHKCSYCDICKTTFSSFQKYNGHKCKGQNSLKPTSETALQISEIKCSKVTQKAVDTNYQSLSCTLCSRQYKSLKTLNNHKCPFCMKCNKVFSSFKCFKQHKCKVTISTQQEITENINLDNQLEKTETCIPSNIEVADSLLYSEVLPHTRENVFITKNSVSELVGKSGTLIPDDVIEEALSIMRKHSPELAPFIGQITPAQFQVLNNLSEKPIVPYIPTDKISINIHYTHQHWLTSVYYPGRNVIKVYDSLYSKSRIKDIKRQLEILYGNRSAIEYPSVTQQHSDPSCGAFAIAFAFSALLGIPPESQCFDIGCMREHLKCVLNLKKVVKFPTIGESDRLAAYFCQQTKLQQIKALQNKVGHSTKSIQMLSINSMSESKKRESKKLYIKENRKQMTEKQKKKMKKKQQKFV